MSSRRFCLKCSPFGRHNTRDLTRRQPGRKRCPRCNKIKRASQFYIRKARGRNELSGYCRICQNEATKARQQAIKREAVAYLGGKCQDCGYKRYVGALEFHHRDPSKKDFKISARNCLSLEQIKPELDKCDLLCANCHRERHARRLSPA